MRTLALLAFLGCAAVAQAQQPKTYSPETAPRANEETVLNARVVSVDPAGARLTVRGADVKADGGRDETFSVAAPATSRLGELKRGMEVLLMLRGTTVVDVKVSTASGGQGAGAATRGRTAAPTAVPAVAATAPVVGTAPAAGTTVIPEGVVPMPADGTIVPGTASPAPNAGPTPSMIGVAPGSGTARTNAQGAITLTGSPVPASPAARPASRRARPAAGRSPATAAPQAAVTPRPTVTPQPVEVAPEPAAPAVMVSPQPVPTPAAFGTPFPTPRPQPTPIPVGTPPPVGTPAPVLVPSEPPPSPATSPATTPTPSPQAP